MINNVTETLAKFSAELQFDDLPEDVVRETKRIILDIVGVALGGLDMDKGRIAINFARQIGGRPEATILGTGEKVPCPSAAFANGES
jgi:2-methylcitrate dehydratase PrpD